MRFSILFNKLFQLPESSFYFREVLQSEDLLNNILVNKNNRWIHWITTKFISINR